MADEIVLPLPCSTEHMQLLVDALESGEYPQGEGALRVDGDDGKLYYCCAGVACDISGTGSWNATGRYSCSDDDSHTAILPLGVVAWLGLTEDDRFTETELRKIPLPESNMSDQVATSLNDHRHPFKDIASRIRHVYLSQPSPSPSLSPTS